MKKQRILVVDDDPKITNLLAVILTRCGGYEVREENCSSRALRDAEEFAPHVILLDVDMPGKDGGELAADLARHGKLSRIPTLFVTSLMAAGETSGQCNKVGGHYFLSKPVLPGLLLRCVRELLESGQVAVAA